MTQSWSADGYDRNARFVSDLGDGVLRLLAPQPGERILDVGCGDGALTVKIVAAGAHVTGIDSSPAFVESARARGIEAYEGDAHQLAEQDAFDAVFSNAALHWMSDHAAVLARVNRALRPGGRFVAELGGHGNVAAIVVAISAILAKHGIDGSEQSPWTFPSVEGFRAQLEDAGFEVDRIELFARPTALPTGIEGWLATFAQPFFAPLDEATRAHALGETIALLRPVLCDRAGRWTADYVRLRFAARKPAGPLA